MSYSIAKRYAQALFDLSCETKECETVSRDLLKIQKLINESDEFVTFLHNPVISLDTRQTILKGILKNKIKPLTRKFILFLNIKNRLRLLSNICQVFEKLYLELKGIIRVKITSSTTINDSQVKEISKHLKSRLKKNIEPTVFKDPSILGGIKIQDGDTIYDYSLSTQLEQFKKNLIKA